MGTSTQAGVPATHVMKAVALLLLPLAAARPDTGFTAFHPQATHSVHGSNVPVHHTHGAVHGVHHAAPIVHHAPLVHHAAPVVHHAVHAPHHHSTIFRGQLPVSVHSHQVKAAAPAPVAAEEEAVEEAVVKAVVEEAIEEVIEEAAEEVEAEVADSAEVVDLRTPEKKEEPVVTTFVHTAPVVHHVTPVVHHAAPVVHSAPVVHHAHQVHGGSHHGALHEIRAPVVVAPVRHVTHHAVHHAPASHNVVHQVPSP